MTLGPDKSTDIVDNQVAKETLQRLVLPSDKADDSGDHAVISSLKNLHQIHTVCMLISVFIEQSTSFEKSYVYYNLLLVVNKTNKQTNLVIIIVLCFHNKAAQ